MKPVAPVRKNLTPTSYQPGRRDRDDEASAAPPVLLLLGEDLLGEVPREQQYLVGHQLEQAIRRVDGQMIAGHVAALLVGVAVHHEVEDVPADGERVEERRALGGGAVGG